MKPKTTGKRIVSKGEYIKAQALTLLLNGLLLACGLGVVLLLANLPQWEKAISSSGWHGCVAPDPTMAFRKIVVLIGVLIVAMNDLSGERRKSKRLLEDLQPLTRANTADLPASDNLVRASTEPMQEQRAVLLRAAEGIETPPEEMLRAVKGQE